MRSPISSPRSAAASSWWRAAGRSPAAAAVQARAWRSSVWVSQVRGHAQGIKRGERLGRPVGLPGQRQCVSCADVRPPGGVGEPELLEKRVGLAGPARGAHQASLFEVQDGEPSGDQCSCFGRRLIGELTIGRGEELFGLAETAVVDQRRHTGPIQAPLVPRFVGLGCLSAAVGWSEVLDGVVESTDPDQAVADHEVRGGERS